MNFVRINIISWLIAFPISVAVSYELNYGEVVRGGISVGKFTKDYFINNWSYMLKLLMKMSLMTGVIFTLFYYLRQAT